MDYFNRKKIEETVREFFDKLTFDVEIEKIESENNIVSIDLKTTHPNMIIGQGGQTLLDIQHVLRSMLRHKIKENFFVEVDINGYKKKKIEYLQEMARSLANEAAINRKEKELSPMSAYERRIIHMELAERSDVGTYSIGEGETRRIVIKPKPEF